MPDLWIDEHAGDEMRPRPEFKAALRSSLAADLARGRTPWRAIGWVAAAVTLIGVVVTVLVGAREDTNTISPSPSGQTLIEQVEGTTWYVATDDGVPVPSRGVPASFELRADGSYVGTDGCNEYGSTIDSQPKSGWSIDHTTLHITGSTDSTAVDCPIRAAMPLVDGSELSLSTDNIVLTIADPGGHTYVATSLPPLSGQALADRLVGVRWTVTSVQNESSPTIAWFELSEDGTISGFNGGCLLYHGDGWSIHGDQLTVPPVTASSFYCLGGELPDINPFTGNTSRITIDGLGLGLTIQNDVVYTAVAQDPTIPATTTTATLPFVPDDALAEAIADRDWYIITADGQTVQSSIWIRLHSDRTVSGNNGCMDYGNDPSAADGWSLNGRLLALPALYEPGDCVGVETMVPDLNGAALTLDATGTRLTTAGPHIYFLSTEPLRDRVAGHRWYVMVHDDQGASVNAWFELHDDGSFSGFDGCNDYASSTDASSPESGWRIEGNLLRVFGEIGSSTVGCSITPLMPVVDGTSLNFEESFDAIYMEGPTGQFTVTLTEFVDAGATTAGSIAEG